MAKCPVCERGYESYDRLSTHFSEEAARSDASHVMWLNRNITKEKGREKELESLLSEFFDTEKAGFRAWVKQRFIERFFGKKPHPFVLALQHPPKGVLIGYVLEHQHFLKQWVRSLSWVLAKTDRADVVQEELDNIMTEFYGYGDDRPSHYELLIRMGESLGLNRKTILETPPLPATASAIETWQTIGREKHWVETMAAMHSLELIANRDVRQDGATITYFDPQILQNDEITSETKAFLHEGYEADVEHSEIPLGMVEKYANEFGIVEDVQVTFLKSVEAFDSYLMGRLERGMRFDGRLVAYAEGHGA